MVWHDSAGALHGVASFLRRLRLLGAFGCGRPGQLCPDLVSVWHWHAWAAVPRLAGNHFIRVDLQYSDHMSLATDLRKTRQQMIT